MQINPRKIRQSAERQARGQKEKRLESNVFAGLAKGVSKVLAPVKGLFEKVFDFIKTVILGRVVVKLVDGLHPEMKIKDKSNWILQEDFW